MRVRLGPCIHLAMKLLLFVVLASGLILSIARSAFAQSGVLRERCTLTDLKQSDDLVRVNLVVELRDRVSATLVTYQGVRYDLLLSDVTQSTDPLPRRQFVISAQNVAKQEVLSSAIAVYTTEVHELNLQVGSSVLVRCTPIN